PALAPHELVAAVTARRRPLQCRGAPRGGHQRRLRCAPLRIALPHGAVPRSILWLSALAGHPQPAPQSGQGVGLVRAGAAPGAGRRAALLAALAPAHPPLWHPVRRLSALLRQCELLARRSDLGAALSVFHPAVPDSAAGRAVAALA